MFVNRIVFYSSRAISYRSAVAVQFFNNSFLDVTVFYDSPALSIFSTIWNKIFWVDNSTSLRVLTWIGEKKFEHVIKIYEGLTDLSRYTRFKKVKTYKNVNMLVTKPFVRFVMFNACALDRSLSWLITLHYNYSKYKG